MFYRNRERLSYLLSVSVHLLLMGVFFFISYSNEQETDEFVTVGFGTFGNVSTPGIKGDKKPNDEVKPKEIAKKEEPKVEEKIVELPEVVQEHDDPIIPPETEKNDDTEVAVTESVAPIVEPEKEETKGEEKAGEGEGNFGFELDFGGKGIRKIYSYDLPSYPEGVSKEIDIKLRFSILADGTVGKIIPLTMGDARLSTASINSLRKWRFEPLSSNQKQINQTAVIVFPYRLQ